MFIRHCSVLWGHPLKDGSPITFTGSRTRCAQTACSLFPLKSITSAALQWDFPSAFIFCNILKTDGAKRFHYSMFDVGRSMFDVYLFIPFSLPPSTFFIDVRLYPFPSVFNLLPCTFFHIYPISRFGSFKLSGSLLTSPERNR